MSSTAEQVLNDVKRRNPSSPLFLQAVTEIMESLEPVLGTRPDGYKAVLMDLVEPDRIVQFKVAWTDDHGHLRVNRGWRVQFNSALGVYKGGLRFHPSLTVDTLKFLGFEQVFKNALTNQNLGGGKGGSDFNPKGKSDHEIRNFCQSFMTELCRHIGPSVDVPAGDIGVGARELGFLFGHYKRIQNKWDSCLTGKGPEWGGSNLRPEATGYGVVYFAKAALHHLFRKDLKGLRCAVSGSGNVAMFAARMILKSGGKVLSLSDSTGVLLKPEGFTENDLDEIQHHKEERRGILREFHALTGAQYLEGKAVWETTIQIDVAFPCATQNEISAEHAAHLLKVCPTLLMVAEGANMPTSAEAVDFFNEKGVVVCPGKAANAGGVAVSGLEMRQNWAKERWPSEKVDEELNRIMTNIFTVSSEAAAKYFGDPKNLIAGANIAAFLRIAEASEQQGVF